MSCYVHSLPGRLRVRIPAIKGNAINAEMLVNQVIQLTGISSVRANPVTGSILIQYDPAVTDEAACLAVLNVRMHQPRETVASTRKPDLASKMTEAAFWYLLEKSV